MPRTRIAPVLTLATAIVLQFTLDGTAVSQTVWTGFDHSFTKPLFADPSAPENQDRITDNVWLTRGNNRGLFNIRKEAGYSDLSPTDTEWATDLIPANDGKEISATNWANLAFEDWVVAYEGGGMQLPGNLTGRNAVLHLISDNIYLDIRFTSWSVGAGGFAYERSPAPIDPPVGPTGDYNENGEVDAADYVLWRDTLSQMVTPAGSGADGDVSGTVDDADYGFWRARFGNTLPIPGGTAAATAVPEPTTCTLIIGLIALRVILGAKRQLDTLCEEA
jgi:hypothetical protein